MSCKPKKRSVFADAYDKRREWNRESDNFMADCKGFIEKALADTPGFKEFNEVVPYYISTDPKLPGWLQVHFGRRPLGRPDTKGKNAEEVGPSLIYSRGPSGEMSMMLFPISSEIARVEEDSLMLGIGYYDYWDLHLSIKQNVRDLIAYAYVSSIDLTPTRSQAWRIWWLRFANSRHVEGKHEYSTMNAGIKNLALLAFNGAFSGIFRLAAPLLVGWLIGMYGNEWLKSLMPGGN